MSDTSSYMETTCSQDQRIGNSRCSEINDENLSDNPRGKENDLNNLLEEKRKQIAVHRESRAQIFDKIFAQKTEPIFSLPGLHIIYYNSKKIKFSFYPCQTTNAISKKIKFYCKLVFYEKYKWWGIQKDSFPLICKKVLYPIFHGVKHDPIKDDMLIATIKTLYEKLVAWSEGEEKIRKRKYLRYKNGDLKDLDLFSEDEELFLNEREQSNLTKKRKSILIRMLPPTQREHFEEIYEDLFRQNSTSDSSD